MNILLKMIMLVFSIVSIFATVITNQSSLFFSSFLNSGKENDALQTEVFLKMLSSENHYFVQDLELEDESIFTNTLQLATNINFKDVRSLMFDEIPGLFSMTSEMLVAGEKTDFTQLPIESSPPIEELMKEREVNQDSLPKDEEKPVIEKPDKNTVFIYHSHNRESFLPHLKDATSPNSAQHKDINISLVGERLGQKLLEHGIGSVVDKTDIASILNERDWGYGKSYQASREVVQEAMTSNKELVYYLDIHRDSSSYNTTTTTINGKNYAKLYFIVGKEHPNYKENMAFANELNNMIMEKYPNLSRKVWGKDFTNGNGIYNQDLSPNALTIEIGGPENSLEEMYNTVDLLAEIFAEYYWKDAIEVNN